MTLLGRHNWWAPGWLARLRERLGLREVRLDRPDTGGEAVVAPAGTEREPALG
jgi:hypothetical protein